MGDFNLHDMKNWPAVKNPSILSTSETIHKWLVEKISESNSSADDVTCGDLYSLVHIKKGRNN